jgi:hypothetical protein
MEKLLLCTGGLSLLIGLVALVERHTQIVQHILHRRNAQK